jgi:hypothetical protein
LNPLKGGRVLHQIELIKSSILIFLIKSEPVRKCLVSGGKPVMEAVEGRIDELLTDWATRTTAMQRALLLRAAPWLSHP